MQAGFSKSIEDKTLSKISELQRELDRLGNDHSPVICKRIDLVASLFQTALEFIVEVLICSSSHRQIERFGCANVAPFLFEFRCVNDRSHVVEAIAELYDGRAGFGGGFNAREVFGKAHALEFRQQP